MRTWKIFLPVVCAIAIAGCGSSSSSSTLHSLSKTPAWGISTTGTTTSSTTSGSTSADPKIVAMVPSALKSKGTMTVASDASYPPNEFVAPDGKTIIGMDPDLMAAIGALMGVKVNIVNATFEGIIPGVAAHKYDVGASSFTDTWEREKTVDFVTYFEAGESLYTRTSLGTFSSDSLSTKSINDICDRTVAVEKGTTEESDADTQSTMCKIAGKPGVTVLTFPDQNGADGALLGGKAQLGFADSPVAAYRVRKSNGLFKLVGQSYVNAPYGLAIAKDSGLAKPIQAAVKKLIANGEYAKILTKWGVQAGRIPASEVHINGAIS